MATATLLLGAVVAIIAASAFFLVAAEIGRRPVSEASRVARDLLRGWWLAVGLYGLLWAGVVNAMALAGIADVRAYVAVRTIAFLAILGGQWALTAHFAFLLTGTRRAFVPLGVFYAATYGLVTFAFASTPAVGLDVGLLVDIVYAPGPEAWVKPTVLFLTSAPVLAASIGYLALARTAEDPGARRRARLVATALILWLGSMLAAGVSENDVARFVTRPILGLAAAATVYFAYRPLQWRPVSEARGAFDQRLRELI